MSRDINPRELDAWIEGRHITWDPRSPYYTGPECWADGPTTCPVCGAEPIKGPGPGEVKMGECLYNARDEAYDEAITRAEARELFGDDDPLDYGEFD